MASAAAKHLKAAASGFRNDFETDPDPELAQYRDMNRAAFLAAHPPLRFVAVAALVFSPQNKNKTGHGEATTKGGGQQLDEKEKEEEEDRLLLMQRAASDSLPLLWEVPGGALDPEDPTVLHGAARELWEEAGLATKKVSA
jgi:8-oxo-dGTP pyrophosphatase MutT (NUDIX family)